MLGTILILGLLVGSLLGGRIGDRFGRKTAMFGAVAVIAPAVIAGGYSTSYEVTKINEAKKYSIR
jgi:MFS family permease